MRKPNNDSESTSKIKVWSRWKVFEILLTSAVISILNVLLGNEIT